MKKDLVNFGIPKPVFQKIYFVFYYTYEECPVRVLSSFALPASHIFMDSSALQDAKVYPSGEKQDGVYIDVGVE